MQRFQCHSHFFLFNANAKYHFLRVFRNLGGSKRITFAKQHAKQRQGPFQHGKVRQKRRIGGNQTIARSNPPTPSRPKTLPEAKFFQGLGLSVGQREKYLDLLICLWSVGANFWVDLLVCPCPRGENAFGWGYFFVKKEGLLE